MAKKIRPKKTASSEKAPKKKFKLGSIKKLQLPSDPEVSGPRKVYAYTNSCTGSCFTVSFCC